jgi:hypothetical protein
VGKDQVHTSPLGPIPYLFLSRGNHPSLVTGAEDPHRYRRANEASGHGRQLPEPTPYCFAISGGPILKYGDMHGRILGSARSRQKDQTRSRCRTTQSKRTIVRDLP